MGEPRLRPGVPPWLPAPVHPGNDRLLAESIPQNSILFEGCRRGKPQPMCGSARAPSNQFEAPVVLAAKGSVAQNSISCVVASCPKGKPPGRFGWYQGLPAAIRTSEAGPVCYGELSP